MRPVRDEPVGEACSGRAALVKFTVEAIGTLLLVFAVGVAVAGRSWLAPLAIGAALIVMIYAGAGFSGGHYNPAVTLAMLLRRRIGLRDAATYWTVQLGLMAAVLVRTIIDPAELATTATSTLTGHRLVAAFVLQLLFTFALCYVVLNGATSTRRSRSSVYGIAIGFVVASAALAVGAICGDVFAWPTLWVYLVSQVIGGAAAGVVFLALNPDAKYTVAQADSTATAHDLRAQ
jgi:aquaporin Z